MVCLVRVVYDRACASGVLCHLAMEVGQMTNQPSNREASHGSNRKQEGQRGLFTWRWGENRDASHRPPASPNSPNFQENRSQQSPDAQLPQASPFTIGPCKASSPSSPIANQHTDGT